MDPQSGSTNQNLLLSDLESHLSERYLWFGETGPKLEGAGHRQSLKSYLARLATVPRPEDKPEFHLDDESLGSTFYGYINVPNLGRSVAVPTNTILTEEYACLSWLFGNALPYDDDPGSHKCPSEGEVKEEDLRKTLADGGYLVVESLEPCNNIYRGARLCPFDDLTAQLYSLSASVTVQDIIGRNAKPRADDVEPHGDAQTRCLKILEDGLEPIGRGALCMVKAVKRAKKAGSTGSSDEESRWDGTTVPFESFLHHSGDHGTIQNFLDCKLYGAGDRPAFISAVADDIRGMSRIQRGTEGIPLDAVAYRSWALLAHAGSLTPVHHDSAGLSTFVVQCSGVKYWFFFQWVVGKAPSLRAQAFRYQAASDHNVISMEYDSQPPWVTYNSVTQEFEYHQDIYDEDDSAKWREEHPKVSQLYVIRLEPGMCLVQPSDAVHTVYNATDCVAVGGHFLSFESLPLAQLGRRVDHVSEAPLTNDSHPAINLVLHGMSLLLADPRVSLSVPALVALGQMVWYPRGHQVPPAEPDELEEVVDGEGQVSAKVVLRKRLEAAKVHVPIPAMQVSPSSSRR